MYNALWSRNVFFLFVFVYAIRGKQTIERSDGAGEGVATDAAVFNTFGVRESGECHFTFLVSRRPK